MTRARRFLRLFLLVTLTAFAPSARAHSGHTTWGAWRFDWEVKDGAGLAIRNVYYADELVLWKASLPVIRVRYDSSCGPYADRITWESLLDVSNCGGAKVCQQSFTTPDGRNWLRIDVLAGIGAYRINHIWFFSNDGYINARLSSRGLHCNINHDHHPHWRFDFDVKGAAGDQTFVYDNNRPDQGWGPGWMKYTQELNDLKNPGTGRVWFVRDSASGHGVWVLPGPDGTADGFGPEDTSIRLYHYPEDEPWKFGATGRIGYLDGEDVQEKDDVFWYVAHMHHEAAEGPDVWHRVGPMLKVAR
jgi:hypothetical protein